MLNMASLRNSPSPSSLSRADDVDVVLYRSNPVLRTASSTSALINNNNNNKSSSLPPPFVPSGMFSSVNRKSSLSQVLTAAHAADGPVTPGEVPDAYADLSYNSASADSFNTSTPSLTYSTSSNSPRGSDDLSTMLSRVSLSSSSAPSGGSGMHSPADDATSSTVKGAGDEDTDSEGTLTMRGYEQGFPLPAPFGIWQPGGPGAPFGLNVNPAGALGFSPHHPQPTMSVHPSAYSVNLLPPQAFSDPQATAAAYGAYNYAPPPPTAYAPPPPPPAPARAQQQQQPTTWLDESLRIFHAQYAGDAPPQALDSARAFLTDMATRLGNPILSSHMQYGGQAGWGGRPVGPPVTPEHAAMLGAIAIPHFPHPGSIHQQQQQQQQDQDQGDDGKGGPAPNNRKAGLYKTEMCHNFMERGSCRYGEKCQFAHGEEELRSVQRHPKWKTEWCRTWFAHGTCPYANRCVFIHPDGTREGMGPNASYLLNGAGGIDLSKVPPQWRGRSSSESKSLLERIRDKEPATPPVAAGTSSAAAATPVEAPTPTPHAASINTSVPVGLPTPKTSPFKPTRSSPVHTSSPSHSDTSPVLPPLPTLRLNTTVPQSFGPQTAPATRGVGMGMGGGGLGGLVLSPTVPRKPLSFTRPGVGYPPLVQSPTRPNAGAHSRTASYTDAAPGVGGGLTVSTVGAVTQGPASAAAGGGVGTQGGWYGAPPIAAGRNISGRSY